MEVVSFTTRQLYPLKKAPHTHQIWGWVGLRAGLETMRQRKISYRCRESNLVSPAHSPSLHRLKTIITHWSEWLRFAGWVPNTARGTGNVPFTHLHRLCHLPAVRLLRLHSASSKRWERVVCQCPHSAEVCEWPLRLRSVGARQNLMPTAFLTVFYCFGLQGAFKFVPFR
jgi:hypothetical protein